MNAVLSPQWRFRNMHAGDIDAIMAIEREIYPYPWTRGNFTDSLASGYHCQIYERDGEIIGYAAQMLVLDEAHLLNISIAASQQGRGFGRVLLQHMLDEARARHAAIMFLEVRVSNLAAISLYQSAGFNEMAVRRNYYPAAQGREDAILMGISL